MLVLLIVGGVFLLWLGTALWRPGRGYPLLATLAVLAWSTGVILLLLALAGFFGMV